MTMERLRARWNGYWFDEGGRRSLAVLRIAVAVSVLMTLGRVLGFGRVLELGHGPLATYRPVALWALAGATPPPAWVVPVLATVAVVATLAMLLGAWSRTSTAVSFVASWLLISLDASLVATWSHDHNLALLAQIALLGGRTGDTLSLDAWWRRRRGLPPLVAERGYQWSVRLAQLMVALMFVSAFAIKMASARGTLAWALSDSLRHHLLLRFDLTGVPRTPVADWLLAEPWRWQAAALGNLVSQLMPIVACLAARRPRLRLVAGAFFVLEVIGLGVVVGLWNQQWLPLAAVFVDWDWRAAAPAPDLPAPGRAVRRVLPLLVAYEVVISFAPRLDQWLRTYPFSSFPMFSKVRAKRPLSVHQSYELMGGTWQVLPAGVIPPDVQARIDQRKNFRTAFEVRDREALRQRLAAALALASGGGPARQVRLWLTVYQAPAVPAPARLDRFPIAVIGELDRDGAFSTRLGRLGRDAQGAFVGVAGDDADALAAARFVAFVDRAPTPRPLEVRRDGARFYFDDPGSESLIVAAVIDEVPYLLADRGR